jgi:hypothetical protein
LLARLIGIMMARSIRDAIRANNHAGALQIGLIRQEQLFTAFHAWISNRSTVVAREFS